MGEQAKANDKSAEEAQKTADEEAQKLNEKEEEEKQKEEESEKAKTAEEEAQKRAEEEKEKEAERGNISVAEFSGVLKNPGKHILLLRGCHLPGYLGLYDPGWNLPKGFDKLPGGYQMKLPKFKKDKKAMHLKAKHYFWKRRGDEKYIFYDRNIDKKEFYTPTIQNKPIQFKWTIGVINPMQYIGLKGLNVKKREYSNLGDKDKIEVAPRPDGWLMTWNAETTLGESGETRIEYFKREKDTAEDMAAFEEKMFQKFHVDGPEVM